MKTGRYHRCILFGNLAAGMMHKRFTWENLQLTKNICKFFINTMLSLYFNSEDSKKFLPQLFCVYNISSTSYYYKEVFIIINKIQPQIYLSIIIGNKHLTKYIVHVYYDCSIPSTVIKCTHDDTYNV